LEVPFPHRKDTYSLDIWVAIWDPMWDPMWVAIWDPMWVAIWDPIWGLCGTLFGN